MKAHLNPIAFFALAILHVSSTRGHSQNSETTVKPLTIFTFSGEELKAILLPEEAARASSENRRRPVQILGASPVPIASFHVPVEPIEIISIEKHDIFLSVLWRKDVTKFHGGLHGKSGYLFHYNWVVLARDAESYLQKHGFDRMPGLARQDGTYGLLDQFFIDLPDEIPASLGFDQPPTKLLWNVAMKGPLKLEANLEAPTGNQTLVYEFTVDALVKGNNRVQLGNRFPSSYFRPQAVKEFMTRTLANKTVPSMESLTWNGLDFPYVVDELGGPIEAEKFFRKYATDEEELASVMAKLKGSLVDYRKWQAAKPQRLKAMDLQQAEKIKQERAGIEQRQEERTKLQKERLRQRQEDLQRGKDAAE